MASGLGHLGFRCTGCGNCCKDLRVPLTSADLRRLVDHAGEAAGALIDWLPLDAVDMTGEPGSFVVIGRGPQRALMTLAQRDAACRFLAPDARCSVYAARPGSCRLYPFDATFGRRGGIRRLRLLGGARCDGAQDGSNDPHALREADQLRWAEHHAYLKQIRTWNRFQLQRLRLGQRALQADAFLNFLGFGAGINAGIGS